MVEVGVVHELLREQHPDLAALPISRVPGGWDNELWRIGDDLAVRLPRSAAAETLLRREQEWLPRLARTLPLPAPVPIREGVSTPMFSRPWTVARWVPGEPADRSPVRTRSSAGLLATFLRELHHAAPPDAPLDPKRGVPLSIMDSEFRERLAAVSELVDGPRIRQVWDKAVAAPEFTGRPVWLHGDLHPANVVTIEGSLAGVIDFGCLCAGDPATDLAAAWTILPPGWSAEFFTAYGGIDQAMMWRARGWTVLLGLALVAIGLAGERGRLGGQPTWLPAGQVALRSCCEEPL
ncbi:MAG TPA: aminoglycoside phosphotransferase family protein [Mycobacteriales bacterium]|nr:aminoglycoside phosphotransferase family protein [Mycobacteriales bacterium]